MNKEQNIEEFKRKFLITMEMILLAVLIISDWTQILNLSGVLFCNKTMGNWIRILFYLPLIFSLQLQFLRIAKFQLLQKVYFFLLQIISAAELLKAILDSCLVNYKSIECIAPVFLNLVSLLVVSSIVLSLINFKESKYLNNPFENKYQ